LHRDDQHAFEVTLMSDKLIWILEDEPGEQFVYQELLGTQFTLTFFSTVQSFQRAYQSQVALPHLLIVDLSLSDENFLQFMRRQENINFPFPFMVISSSDDLEVLRDCFQIGAVDCLTKPFMKNELIAKVERLVGREQKPIYSEIFDITAEPLTLRLYKTPEKFEQLTVREFKVFLVFLEAKGDSVSRDQLIQKVWKNTPVSDTALNVHLFHLRGKLSRLGLEIRYLPPNQYMLLKKMSE
jgi:two-component system, OmpR family, alkaline phosphatase synthesis response regulator PhoP